MKCGYRNLEAKNQHGQTAVHLAAMEGVDEILKKLVESKASVNCRDSAGYTPLHVSFLVKYSFQICLSVSLKNTIYENIPVFRNK